MGADFPDIDREGQTDFFVVEMLSRDYPPPNKRQPEQPAPPVPGGLATRLQVARNTLFWNRGDGPFRRGGPICRCRGDRLVVAAGVSRLGPGRLR
ncbi:MAG: hypothetical protein Ct9H300mP32_4320 [Verrucomicrobiota bacterium]|nr:MAG: hypothetical protein Ct9H300mP32_4320 [Verrucomicrobiota bacterium]